MPWDAGFLEDEGEFSRVDVVKASFDVKQQSGGKQAPTVGGSNVVSERSDSIAGWQAR